ESDEINPFPRTGRECSDDIVQLEISARHQPPRSPGRISDDWLEPRTALIRDQRPETRDQRSEVGGRRSAIRQFVRIRLSKSDMKPLTFGSSWKIETSPPQRFAARVGFG